MRVALALLALTWPFWLLLVGTAVAERNSGKSSAEG